MCLDLVTIKRSSHKEFEITRSLSGILDLMTRDGSLKRPSHTPPTPDSYMYSLLQGPRRSRRRDPWCETLVNIKNLTQHPSIDEVK